MKQYVVDAFTEKVFEGNPAAVCVMDEWIPEELMMKITRENNISETAFSVKEEDGYKLRWFTPGGEVDLCGHATLATAYVITKFIEPELNQLKFNTRSGILKVIKKGDLFEMDFPVYDLMPVKVTDAMTEAIGVKPTEAFIGRDLLCVIDSEEDVRNMMVDMDKVKALDGSLLNVTAKGKTFDCVSRSFAPKLNVPEDPVCGSAHCHIIPYWANRLGENKLVAYQASARGGTLYCEYEGNRVKMSGHAALFSIAEIYV